jgi:hypothetical protein
MQREVVRWLQSLDLSFPVKNPKRDLTTGFTVAEILSRYDKEVAMHSFDTGLAMTRRIDNWNQIQKILQRMECATITKELVESTMQSKGDGAMRLIEELYMHLTKRPLRENVIAPVKPTALDMPGYARPTAAIVLREANDPSTQRLQQATGQIDAEKIRIKNEMLLQQHTAVLQTLKVAEPERYVADVPQVKPKTVAKEKGDGGAARAAAKSKLVTERQVASVPPAVLQQFAQREAAVKEAALRQGFPASEDMSTALSRVLARAVREYGLEQLFDSASDSASASDAPDAGGYFSKFFVVRSAVPADAKNVIWTLLFTSAKNIAKHLRTRPREIHHLFVALAFCFTKDAAKLRGFQICGASDAAASLPHKYTEAHHPQQEQINAALDVANGLQLLVAVGRECTGISTELTGSLLEQFIIPRLALCVATASTAFVEAIAKVLAAFVHSAHGDGLQRLLSLLDVAVKSINPEKFFTLTTSIFSCFSFPECPGSQALCLYYAIAAMNSESGVVQGFGLLLLRRLAQAKDGVALLTKEINQSEQLAVSAPLWEVRLAGLDLLCAFWEFVTTNPSLFKAAGDGEDEEESPSAESAAVALSKSAESAIVDSFESFALCPLAQRKLSLLVVSSYRFDHLPDQLNAAFFDRIGQFSNADRRSFFSFGDEGDIQCIEGRLRAVYVTGGVFSTWKGESMVAALCRQSEALNALATNLKLDLTLRTIQSQLDAFHLSPVAVSVNKKQLLRSAAAIGRSSYDTIISISEMQSRDDADVPEDTLVVLELAKRIIFALFHLSDAHDGAEEDGDEETMLTNALQWMAGLLQE